MGELFSTFGINLSLLVTQIINFGLLLLALWYFLYRPVFAMIDARQRKIEEGVHNAESASARLKEIEGERDNVLKQASLSADEILATSKTRAQAAASQTLAEASSRAETIVIGAQKQAEEAKAQALRESQAEISKAAILAAERILREKQS